jgi:hypothetical protein
MNEFLLEAYKSTTYQTQDPVISLRIGEISEEADALMLKLEASTYCFITAHNPFSKGLSDLENNERQVELLKDLKEYKTIEGAGVPADKSWSPEPSFLVVGISRDESIRLSKKYEQNAIVFGELGGVAELVVTV